MIGRLNALRFKGVDAKFDKVADDAFTVAANAIENRSKEYPYGFIMKDLEAAKTLKVLRRVVPDKKRDNLFWLGGRVRLGAIKLRLW